MTIGLTYSHSAFSLLTAYQFQKGDRNVHPIERRRRFVSPIFLFPQGDRVSRLTFYSRQSRLLRRDIRFHLRDQLRQFCLHFRTGLGVNIELLPLSVRHPR